MMSMPDFLNRQANMHLNLLSYPFVSGGLRSGDRRNSLNGKVSSFQSSLGTNRIILTTIFRTKMTNLMIALMGAVKHPNMQQPIAPPSHSFLAGLYNASLSLQGEDCKSPGIALEWSWQANAMGVLSGPEAGRCGGWLIVSWHGKSQIRPFANPSKTIGTRDTSWTSRLQTCRRGWCTW